MNDIIRAELARRQRTQGALATHLHLSQPAIHRRMTGKVAWRISELRSTAEFLEISISDLVSEPAEVGA
ncbi:helix-turn-helix domain-containing protein [Mycolicibacterium palauense]|uniref:helix-turn-helix domain-containing protein n=1 Tax=Mycolicibacterium palauense TaxID=2034511 RepID=UPI001C3F2D59|nr:helix-turn-helix domain-containing protein [Mycolicibacterium palauense]